MPYQPLDIPERIGRYEIVQRLAAGGMGEVFVARMAGPGGFVKPVALKRIHPHLVCDPKFIVMLHDEARLTASIEHPNIVRTLDVGSEGGIHYVVFDYVCGDQIGKVHREILRRGETMPPWLVAWVGVQVGEALHAVHEARGLDGEPLEIVHRDVSPGNIMLADSGHVMLFDFGVAKARQRLAETNFGELKGKLAYMAPEVFDGMPVDRTVDVFSLGTVLYELLTGHTPFHRETDLETIAALRGAQIPAPSRVRRGIDNLLDEIVLKAMDRERGKRFMTAADLATALRRWAVLTASPQSASTVSEWLTEVVPRRIARRRALLARVASGVPIQPDERTRNRAISGDPTILAAPPTEVIPTPIGGTSAGVAMRTAPAPSPGRVLLPIAAGLVALGLGGALGLAVYGRNASTAPDASATAEEVAAPPPVETAQPTPEPASSPQKSTQKSASAAPSSSVPPATKIRHAPTKAPSKKGGPLEREYD